MGMTAALTRAATRRVHVLTVEVRGNWVLRAAVERRVAARGWCAAVSPADADLLAVCGMPGSELGEVVERIWDQLPGPVSASTLLTRSRSIQRWTAQARSCSIPGDNETMPVIAHNRPARTTVATTAEWPMAA